MRLKLPNRIGIQGFLKDYSSLKETTSASGKPELRWISPDYNPKNYDNVVYNPITYYPIPKPSTPVGAGR